jgi:uncharacterized protein
MIMSIPGWTDPESPFHPGEIAIQTRLGVQEQIEQQGRRMIRDFLPDQHRQFFTQLSYVLVGTIDATGNPWASILAGNPGFLSAPDDRTLRVETKPLWGDPFVTNLSQGSDIGLLGIDLSTRRRNRLNGIISAIDPTGFEIRVKQCFGNCPQYIQMRRLESFENTLEEHKPVRKIELFGESERSIITNADTFFIATAYQSASAGRTSGIDVSHRGGKPGFVNVTVGEASQHENRTLTIPDFSGNHHFNTFGNLALNPRAGLLFLDFDRGDLLYLTGTAEVIWEGAEILAYAGAERLLRFQLDRGYRVEGSLPWRWSAPEFFPFLASMGSWE